jgi:hypothetical protein
MEQAIEYLKELRHTKIGYIGGSSMITISDHRANAFMRVMKKFGLAVNPDFMQMGNYRVSGGQRARLPEDDVESNAQTDNCRSQQRQQCWKAGRITIRFMGL